MTCHNRRDITIASLEALASQPRADTQLLLYLTDDGSTDGTADAVNEIWPGARIIQGTGDLYWASGMSLAERSAVRDQPDFLLWLNDDTLLDDGALVSLLSTSSTHPDAIVVGAATDPDTGECTYGGRIRVDRHPQRFRPLRIADHAQWADTFNGNVVLIPWSVRERVGPIDGLFPHAYADDDYGLRATALGVPIVQASGSVALCPRNPPARPIHGGPVARWRQLQQPDALPWRAQARYLKRHGTSLWPLILVGGQVRRVISGRL